MGGKEGQGRGRIRLGNPERIRFSGTARVYIPLCPNPGLHAVQYTVSRTCLVGLEGGKERGKYREKGWTKWKGAGNLRAG